MERERQICFVGCWLLGAVIGFVIGAAARGEAINLLMTPAQREFYYGAVIDIGLAGLAAARSAAGARWRRRGGCGTLMRNRISAARRYWATSAPSLVSWL